MIRKNIFVVVAVLIACAAAVSAQTPLVPGVPVTGTVAPFQFQNYTFIIKTPLARDRLTITTSSGVVFAFAAFNAQPTFTTNDWKDVTPSTVKTWPVDTTRITQVPNDAN
jgi:hypothetical protein